MSNNGRIWLELAVSDNIETMRENALKATKIIYKLNPHMGIKIEVIENKGYILASLDNSGYLELVDNGHWFDMELLLK